MTAPAFDFGDHVKRASDLTNERAGIGSDRFLPCHEALRPLLPGMGLRRGSTIGITISQARHR